MPDWKNMQDIAPDVRRQIEKSRIRLMEDDDPAWHRIRNDYGFRPNCVRESYDWIRLPQPSRTFLLAGGPWDEAQETLVNSFFVRLGIRELYALDWQHDCFVFSPGEKIPLGFQFNDSIRDFMVYFPEYYPNGDYHFFTDPEWKYGMYGHPWLREMAVTGGELIRLFEENAGKLGLKPKK